VSDVAIPIVVVFKQFFFAVALQFLQFIELVIKFTILEKGRRTCPLLLKESVSDEPEELDGPVSNS
jgi:hypothetical protein